MDMVKLEKYQGFCADLAGASCLLLSSLFGIPVSTTHTITGSIIGVGMTRGFASVKWITAKKIVWAWLLTIPVSGFIACCIYYMLDFLIG